VTSGAIRSACAFRRRLSLLRSLAVVGEQEGGSSWPGPARGLAERSEPEMFMPVRLQTVAGGSGQPAADPGGIPPTIQHSMNADDRLLDTVVYGEGKALRKQPLKAELDGVNACMKLQGVDVREKGVEEVIAESRHLALVEPVAVNEVLLGLVQNLDPHLVRSRILCFASAQSTNWEEPC